MDRPSLRRAFKVLAFGGTSIAACVYAYRWWTLSNSNEQDEPICGTGTPNLEESPGRRELDAEENSLILHFNNIQHIADIIHFPRLIVSLWQELQQADNVDSLREEIKLQSNKSKSAEAAADLVSLWKQLMEASFVRFVLTSWSLPLGFLVTRVVLGLMGRSMYMGHAVDKLHQGMTPRGQRRNILPKIFTKECQGRLLGILDLVPGFIVRMLLPHVQGAVASEIGFIDLKAPFTASELLELISRLHDQVSKVVSSLPLRFALSTDKVPAMESLRGYIPLLQPHYWSETDLVNDMLEEARGILDCNSFKTTYINAMKTFSRQSAVGVSSIFEQAGRKRNSQLPPRPPAEVNKAAEKSEGTPEREQQSAKPGQGGESNIVHMNIDFGKPAQNSSSMDADHPEGTSSQRLSSHDEAKSAPSLPFVKCGTQLLSLSKDWFSTTQRTPMEGIASLGFVHDFCLDVYTSNNINHTNPVHQS